MLHDEICHELVTSCSVDSLAVSMHLPRLSNPPSSIPLDLSTTCNVLTGAPPFEQAGVKETLQCIITGQYTVPPGLSEQAEDFMKCLINLVSTIVFIQPQLQPTGVNRTLILIVQFLLQLIFVL